MSSKVRLWVNMAAIIVAFAIIAIAVSVIFKKSSTFLNPPGVNNMVKELNMDIIGKINDRSFFEIKFRDGQADKRIDNLEVDALDTTFTEEKQVLSYTLSFENKSNGTIYIKITGIYFDEFNRFHTYAEVSTIVGNPIYREGGTGDGSIIFEITKPEDQDSNIVDVTLTYTLQSLNRKIDNARQNLNIIISNEAFER